MLSHIANYHSHVYLCGHAEGDVEDYLKEAERTGLVEVGISDHAPIPVAWTKDASYNRPYGAHNMTMDTFYNVYLPSLEQGIKDHPQLNVLKALESEYLPPYKEHYETLLSSLDYLVLGVHYFKMEDRVVDTYSALSDEEALAYASAVEEALDTHLFKVLAHPDLFMMKRVPSEEIFTNVKERLVKACIKNNVYMEVNANGRGRYPYEAFFKGLEQSGVKFLVNSDAHKIENMNGQNVREALEFSERLHLPISLKMEF